MVSDAIRATVESHPVALGSCKLVLAVERNLQRQAGTLALSVKTRMSGLFHNGILIWSDDMRKGQTVPINYGFLTDNESKILSCQIAGTWLASGMVKIGNGWPGTERSIADSVTALYTQISCLRVVPPGDPTNKTDKYQVSGKSLGNDDLSITFISLMKAAVQFMTQKERAHYDICRTFGTDVAASIVRKAHHRVSTGV